MQHILRLKRLYIVGVFAFLLFPGAQALAVTYLVEGGVVTKIASTNGNTSSFAIQVTGGSVNTCAGVWINFNQADAPDAATFTRAYAAALLALTTGVTVQIVNYFDTTCQRAGYVELD